MSNVINIAFRRSAPTHLSALSHPAGVEFPKGKMSGAEMFIPEIEDAIQDGTYRSDVIRRLPELVRPGDRVLIIGAGLGVVSTLVAKCKGVTRVIAAEPNVSLIPHLNRVHALNGVPEVETINALLGTGSKGRVGFFARRNLRASSTSPDDGPWEQAMMVPWMDLNLILTEERINLVICESPVSTEQLLECVEHESVERIVVSGDEDASGQWEQVSAANLVANHDRRPASTKVFNRRMSVSAVD